MLYPGIPRAPKQYDEDVPPKSNEIGSRPFPLNLKFLYFVWIFKLLEERNLPSDI